MRQLSNEARLDNFDAAALRLQYGAHTAAEMPSAMSERVVLVRRRRGLSRLVYRQSNGKLRTHQQLTNERSLFDV